MGHSIPFGRFEQSSWQITVPMHGPALYDFPRANFVKEDVLPKRAEDEKKAPVAQARVSKAGERSKSWLHPEELTSCLDGVEIIISHIPVRIGDIPIVLLFNVGDEVIRFADVHEAVDLRRARARRRIATKSRAVSGVKGLSAASNNHASRSGVTAKGLARWSRTEQRTSLTRLLASAQIPA